MMENLKKNLNDEVSIEFKILVRGFVVIILECDIKEIENYHYKEYDQVLV